MHDGMSAEGSPTALGLMGSGAGGDGAPANPAPYHDAHAALEQQALMVMGVDLSDQADRERVRRSVETLGFAGARSLAARSRLLEARIRSFAQVDPSNTTLVDDLGRLAERMGALDPAHTDDGHVRRWGRRGASPRESLGRLVSARPELDGAIARLASAAETLRQNSVALDGYERDLDAEARQLAADIEMADAFESALSRRLERARAEGADPGRLRFVQGEVLLPLEQRRQDLRSLQALNQQAALAVMLLRETNTALVQHVRLVTQAAAHTLDVAVMLHRAQAVGYDELAPSFAKLYRVLDAYEGWRRVALPRAHVSVGALQEASAEASGHLGGAGGAVGRGGAPGDAG